MNDWRTAKGTKPANLDMFLALCSVMTTRKVKNVKVSCHTKMYAECIRDLDHARRVLAYSKRL